MSEKLCVHCQKPVGRGTRNTQHGYLHDECWDEYFAGQENVDPDSNEAGSARIIIDRINADS